MIKKIPVACNKDYGHLVFYARMTLGHEIRWAKDEHKTSEPEQSIFDRVVQRDRFRIALSCAALNYLPACAYDDQNDYLQALSSEKQCVVHGPEFGLKNVGKHKIIVHTLYGGKNAGADYWRHIRSATEEMGFSSCKDDTDVFLGAHI